MVSQSGEDSRQYETTDKVAVGGQGVTSDSHVSREVTNDDYNPTNGIHISRSSQVKSRRNMPRIEEPSLKSRPSSNSAAGQRKPDGSVQ